jgi:hypothetical protein
MTPNDSQAACPMATGQEIVDASVDHTGTDVTMAKRSWTAA